MCILLRELAPSPHVVQRVWTFLCSCRSAVHPEIVYSVIQADFVSYTQLAWPLHQMSAILFSALSWCDIFPPSAALCLLSVLLACSLISLVECWSAPLALVYAFEGCVLVPAAISIACLAAAVGVAQTTSDGTLALFVVFLALLRHSDLPFESRHFWLSRVADAFLLVYACVVWWLLLLTPTALPRLCAPDAPRSLLLHRYAGVLACAMYSLLLSWRESRALAWLCTPLLRVPAAALEAASMGDV